MSNQLEEIESHPNLFDHRFLLYLGIDRGQAVGQSMRQLTKEEIDKLFPTTCHFKVITVSLSGIQQELDQALVNNGITDRRFQPSAQSKGGKYMSFEIALEIQTHEKMLQLDRDFRRIDGVKMVL